MTSRSAYYCFTSSHLLPTLHSTISHQQSNSIFVGLFISPKTLLFKPTFLHTPISTFSSTSNPTHIKVSLPKENPAIQEFLRESCGLSHDSALRASRHLDHLKSTRKPEQVLGLFKQNGFTDAQIRDMVSRRPDILTASVEKTLQPKLKVFEGLGIVGNQLASFISRDPMLLKVSLKRKLVPGISFLQNALETDENVVKALTREPWLLHVDLGKKIQPNIKFLQSCGVVGKQVSNFFLRKPRFLLCSPTLVKDIVKTVEKMGVSRHSSMFAHAVYTVSSMSKKTLERKLDFLISLGLSKEEALEAFRKLPYVLSTSEEKIQDRMNFLVKTLKYESSLIVRYPNFFMFSTEARIKPRYRVLQTLESMQLFKRSGSILSIFSMTEKSFLEKFVFRYDNEVSNLYEIYKGTDGIAFVSDLDAKKA
eukprot:Gb_00751 [translate_table: standard]